MSLKSKIILNTLFGAIGGLAAWAIIEVTCRGFFAVPYHQHTPGDIILVNIKIGLIAGLFIGGMLGFADGLWSRSATASRRAVISGCIAGAVGGFLGITIGQTAFDMLSPDPKLHSFAAFTMRVFARSIGWTIVGGALGAAQGIPNFSAVKARHGAIGGLIGGFIGGMSFELVANILRSDTHSRLITFTLTGLLIGFMIGLVQNLLKAAWVVILRANNEGREVPIYKPVTTIGRDELADIPVFADRSVGEKHALIRVENRRHVIEDLGNVLGVSVNGQKVAKQPLKDRDVIEMGSVKLLFRERATESKHVPQPDKPRASDPVQIPASPHLCPFCGGIKNASGDCDCSIGASPTAAPAPAQAPTQAQAPAPPTATQQALKLVAVSGPYAPGVFELLKQETTIGREAGRDIELLNDNTVSRRHSRIVREASGWVVYDDGSSNGTFVNGGRITRAAVSPGDMITVGSTEFRVEA